MYVKDFSGQRCWVSGWGKDALGEEGNYQPVLKEVWSSLFIIHDMKTKLMIIIHYKVDVPVLSNKKCESALQKTRLGEDFLLHPVRLIMDGN